MARLHPGQADFEHVASRLGQAGMTLLALQVRGLRPAGFRSSMPTPEGSVNDDRRLAPPAPRQISEMDEAYGWVALIPPHHLALRRLVQARSLTIPAGARSGKPLYSWKSLGRWLGCSDHTAKTWWIGAIDMIVLRLNETLFCGHPRFRGTRATMLGALEAAADRVKLGPIDRIRHLERA